MVVTPSERLASVIEVPLKAFFPMVVIEAGKVEPLHPKISLFVAVSTTALQLSRESYTELPLSTTIVSRLSQWKNGLRLGEPCPRMLVTEAGIVIDVIEVQYWNAP